MSNVKIVGQIGSHRLIRNGWGLFAVLEERDGLVMSVTPGDERTANVTLEGMTAVADGSWTDEQEARKTFDAAIRNGERYAKKIW